MEPIDYNQAFSPVNLSAKFAGIGEALQARKQRIAAEELKTQYSNDVRDALQNPSIAKFNELTLKYPGQREAFKDVAGRFTQDQIDAEFNVGAQVAVALENQEPEIALKLLNKEISARQASNLPITTYEQIQSILSNQEDPDRIRKAQGITNFSLSLINPEKFKKVSESFEAQQTRPDRVREQTAKAQKAAVDAEFAKADAIQGLNLKAAQIENYASQQDIARANLKINALNAGLKREENVLKRDELVQKIDQARSERDMKIREKNSEAMNVLADTDNVLNTADRLLANYGKDKKGNIDPTKPNNVAKSATGTIESQLFTVFESTANFEALIESMESQAFLSQVNKMRGLGALTEREGGRLTSALGSLKLTQSPEQLGRNILEIQRLMLKGRAELENKYGVSVDPDRPALGVPSAMGTATDRAVTPGMPSGFRVLRD